MNHMNYKGWDLTERPNLHNQHYRWRADRNKTAESLYSDTFLGIHTVIDERLEQEEELVHESTDLNYMGWVLTEHPNAMKAYRFRARLGGHTIKTPTLGDLRDMIARSPHTDQRWGDRTMFYHGEIKTEAATTVRRSTTLPDIDVGAELVRTLRLVDLRPGDFFRFPGGNTAYRRGAYRPHSGDIAYMEIGHNEVLKTAEGEVVVQLQLVSARFQEVS